MKRHHFLTLIMAILIAMPVFSTSSRTIYLNTGGKNLWNENNAVPFAYVWESGSDFLWTVELTPVSDSIYSVNLSTSYIGIIFVRMPAGSTWITSHSDILNETDAMSIPDVENMYTITGWKKSDGFWSTYVEGNVLDNGTCGEALTWEYYSSGVLKIIGSGSMNNYYKQNVHSPWYKYRESITSILLPQTLTRIGSYAFKYCTKVTEICIPDAVTSIGEGAFFYCSALTSLTIPENLTSIEYGANFQWCTSLKKVIWNARNCGITKYDNSYSPPFGQSDNIESFTFGDEVETITPFLCSNRMKMTTINIPNSVTKIGESAFDFAKNLTTMFIPESVKSIEDNAFQNCDGLTALTCEAKTPPALGPLIFYKVNKSIPLYVPQQSIAAYQNAEQWKDFTNIQAIDGSATGYTITVKANNDAWGTVSGSGTFPKDTIVDITATPATGYEFKQWSDGNTANPRKVTVLSDSVFTAVFAEKDVVPEGKRAIYLNTGGYWWGNSFDYYIHAWKDKNNPTTIKFDYIADYLYRAYVNEEYTTAFIFYLSPNETITSIDEIWDNFMWDNRQTTIPSDKDMYVITSSYMGVWSAVEFGEWAVYDKNKSAVSFAYGSCGAKAEYAVRRDSILVITGTGEMSHYSTSTNNENPRWNWAPWEGWKGIIKDVQLKEGLTTIGAFAFELCKNITSVTIPSTVTAIGSGAFYAEKFTSITCKATTPPAFVLSSETNTVKHLFQNVDFSIPVYVPAGSVAAYKAADYWKDFTNIQAISGSTPPEVQSILTVAEAITATNALEDDATGDTEVTVEGYVVDALNFDTQYQDQIFYLADDESNSGKQYFQAYFCVAKENDTPVPVQIGDKVRLTGFLTKYMKNGSAYPEIKHGVATFVSKADKDRSTSIVDTITVARALELGATLKENEIYLRHFAIIGYITKIDNYSSLTNTHYTYFWMTDTQGSAATNATGAIYVYKGQSDVKLAVGDRVCVTGLVQNHKDTIEVEDNPTVLRINPGDANPSSKLYTIYVTVNNAKLGTVKGGGTYKSGAIVTLTATPVNGAKFEKWSDGDTYASRTVYATSNSTYTAVFKAIVSDHQTESNNQYDEKSGFIDPWENKANNAPANIQMSDDCTTSTLKVIHNGQLYIIHNGAMFNAQGVRVE